MNRTEVHPIELAIVAAWVVIEALLVLVVAAAAVVVTLAQWRPAKKTGPAKPSLLAGPINTAPSTPAAPPLQHPLAALVAERRPAEKTSRPKTSLLAHDINTAPSTPAAPPLQHPLAALVAELQLLPVATLRGMAGTRSKRRTKAQLIEVIACS